MGKDNKKGNRLKLVGVKEIKPEDGSVPEIESGDDKFSSGSEKGLPEEDEIFADDVDNPLGDADNEKEEVTKEAQDEKDLFGEDDVVGEELDWENLSRGKHALQKNEIFEINDILTQIHNKTVEVGRLKKNAEGVFASHFFDIGADAFFDEKEERAVEIIFERILKDENHTSARDIEQIYQEYKIVELMQSEVGSLGRDNSTSVFLGTDIPFSMEELSGSLDKSETLLSPIYELVLSMIKSGEDEYITDVFTQEFKDFMLVKLYSEDIFNIFPN